MQPNGFFVISLDFELYWGMFDKVTLSQYGDNIRGVQQAIPEILTLFEQNGIHATWATVGMLMTKNKQTLMAHLPQNGAQPKYTDMNVSAYEHIRTFSIGETEQTDPYHYGPSLVKKIMGTKGQELGSHTFSHYYCLDGVKNDTTIFAADCDAFKRIATPFTTQVTSIVFPRNQMNEDALATCSEFGFTAYRGTPQHFLYTGKKEKEQTNLLLRALRLIDTYINLTGHHTFSINSTATTQLKNVQGSWFFRPYSKTLSLLESLKLRRIKNSMTYAAKHNQIFHLWWHPHNFGINRKENLQNLIEIIDHFKTLKTQYGMQSASMKDITQLKQPRSTS